MAGHHPKSLPPTSINPPVTRDPVIASLLTEKAPEFALSNVAPSARRENPSPRFTPIDNDTMEPTLRRGDYVAVLPCEGYEVEGFYLIDLGGSSRIFRCCSDYRGGIDLISDNAAYPKHTLTREEFGQHVLGRAVAHFRSFA